jgi:ATP-dependent exoDNAse (exonuclease V) alpha subunit
VIEVKFTGGNLIEIIELMGKFVSDTMSPPKAEAKPPWSEVKAEPSKPKPDAKERMAKARAAKGKKKVEPSYKELEQQTYEKVVHDDYAKQLKQDLDARPIEAEPASPFDEPEPEPELNLVALRIKTTEELQKAFAEGKHTQVMALLSKYGNGARSFRELQVEDFIPLRKAIDEGALA